MKQTAVEFLVKNTPNIYWEDSYWADLFEQAKEMEKQQLEDAFVECWKSNVPEGAECKLSFNEWFEQFKNK